MALGKLVFSFQEGREICPVEKVKGKWYAGGKEVEVNLFGTLSADFNDVYEGSLSPREVFKRVLEGVLSKGSIVGLNLSGVNGYHINFFNRAIISEVNIFNDDCIGVFTRYNLNFDLVSYVDSKAL